MEEKVKTEISRLYSLDYLRGFAALGIMLYHYSSWAYGRYTADTFMGRVGVYGVAIFYVLSGLTLFHVYHDAMKPALEEIKFFLKKRFFRIFPLLWVVTILSILISSKWPNFYHLFLNLTGLFGFLKWDVTFSGGVWSIGNELVFYVFFPFFVFFSHKNKILFWLLGATIFLIFIYFAFIKLNCKMSSYQEKRDYFNPLNNLFLFFGGFLIGKLFSKKYFSPAINFTVFILGLALFIYYPVSGNRIDLITGTNRLVFTFSCFLICLALYKADYKIPNPIHNYFIVLGDASYSIYLLHPLVMKMIKLILNNSSFNPTQIMIISIMITLILSYYSYKYFEKFFIDIGKKKVLSCALFK